MLGGLHIGQRRDRGARRNLPGAMLRTLAAAGFAAALLVGAGVPDASAGSVPMKLDPAFGVAGRVLLDIGGPATPPACAQLYTSVAYVPGVGALGECAHEDEFFSVVLQPDGKIVASSKGYSSTSGTYDFVIARYNSDGSPDTTFNGSGHVIVDFMGGFDEALAVAIQPDGKIVAGGLGSNAQHTVEDFALVRLNSDGTLDSTFGYGGKVTTDFADQAEEVSGLGIQADGKIVAGGWAKDAAGNLDFALARYNSNGSLDTTYGSNGRVLTDFAGSDDAIYRMRMLPDGRVLAVGATRASPTASGDFAIARYNTDGSLDASLSAGGTPGRITTDFMGGADYALALLPLADGRFYVGGVAFNSATGTNDFGLARYNADGSLDQSFGVYGKKGVVTTDFFGNWDQLMGLGLQPDGKVVAAGHVKHPVRGFEFGAARYLPNGDIDTSFGYGGRFTLDWFGGADGAHDMLLQDDGKLLLAGDAYNPFHQSDDNALARVLIADPSWIWGVASQLPLSAVGSETNRTGIAVLIYYAQYAISNNNNPAALSLLGQLRGHLNGCGTTPDSDDWVIDCAAQTRLRGLVDQVIYKLGG